MSNHFPDSSKGIKLISGQGSVFWSCLKLVGLEKSFGRLTFLRCKSFVCRKSLLFRCFRQQFYKTLVAAYFSMYLSKSSRGHIIPVSGPDPACRPCLAPQVCGKCCWLHPQKAAQTPTKGQVESLNIRPGMFWPWCGTSRIIRGCWEQWSVSSFSGVAPPATLLGENLVVGGKVVSI